MTQTSGKFDPNFGETSGDFAPNICKKVNENNGHATTEATTNDPLDTDTDKKEEERKISPSALGADAPDRDEEPSASADDIDKAFDEFWAAYHPKRRERKVDARKYFRSIVTGKHKTVKRVSPEAIIAAAKAHTEHWQRTGKEPRYIPQAATWVNEGRWEDDLDAGAAKASADPKIGPDHPEYVIRVIKGEFRDEFPIRNRNSSSWRASTNRALALSASGHRV